MSPITPSPTDMPDESENVPAGNSENPGILLSDSDSLSDSEVSEHNGYEPLSQDPENVYVNENDEEDCNSESEMEDSTTTQANNLNLCSHYDPIPASSCNIKPEVPVMDEEHIETIKSVMKGITLPSSNLPPWANQVPEEEWKAALLVGMLKNETKNSSNSRGTHSKVSVNNSHFDLSSEVLR